MNCQRTFSLQEAQKLLPQLRAMLNLAKDELNERAVLVEEANSEYKSCESVLATTKSGGANKAALNQIRTERQKFEQAIETLSQAQQSYLDCLTIWIERISDTGVLLRDLRTGLLDFPARQGELEYFLCWRQEEDEIGYWHLANDGFVGRRPLAVLAEYI